MVADRFRLRYRLKPEQLWEEGLLALRRASRQRGGLWLFALSAWGLAIFLIGGGMLLMEFLQKEAFSSNSFLFGAFVALLNQQLASRLCLRRSRRNLASDHAAVGEFSLVAYEGGGLQVTGEHVTSSYEWTAFLEVSEGSDFLILWTDRDRGVVIPFSAFHDEEEKQHFVDFVNERIKSQTEG